MDLKRRLSRRWEEVRTRISRALERASRTDFPKVVVASKYMDVAFMRALYEVGLRCFGENHIQSAEKKINELADLDIEWHFIGHLQRNKVNKFLSLPFQLIHSVDSLRLVSALEKRAEVRGIRVRCLLEVNVSGEASKWGFRSRGELAEAIDFIRRDCPHLECVGLMTMAPYTPEERLLRRVFSQLRSLAEEFSLPELSMGTSNDFEIAVEEGATIVRIGSVFLE